MREMQIIRCQYTPVRVAEIQNTAKPAPLLVGMQNGPAAMEDRLGAHCGGGEAEA